MYVRYNVEIFSEDDTKAPRNMLITYFMGKIFTLQEFHHNLSWYF